MKKVTLTTPSDCKKAWNENVKAGTIFDLWDFRLSFQESFQYELFFHVFTEGKRTVGFVPLWYSTIKKTYECMGGGWCDRNNFFSYKKPVLETIVKELPAPLLVHGIDEYSLDGTARSLFQDDEADYYRGLEECNDMSAVLSKLAKKHRYNLVRGHRQILDLKPEAVWIADPKAQLEYLLILEKMSVARFDAVDGETSTFVDPREIECFRNIIRNKGAYDVIVLAVKVGGQVVAVEFIAEYNKVWYVITGANDLEKCPGVGAYVTYIEFEKALELGIKRLNVLQEDCGWKHRYFDQSPMVKLVK